MQASSEVLISSLLWLVRNTMVHDEHLEPPIRQVTNQNMTKLEILFACLCEDTDAMGSLDVHEPASG